MSRAVVFGSGGTLYSRADDWFGVSVAALTLLVLVTAVVRQPLREP